MGSAIDRSFAAPIPGEGWTAALLRTNGIKVLGEDQRDAVERDLARDDA